MYLHTKFGCDRSLVVGCRPSDDRQTNKQTSWNDFKAHSLRDVTQQTYKQTGLTIRLTISDATDMVVTLPQATTENYLYFTRCKFLPFRHPPAAGVRKALQLGAGERSQFLSVFKQISCFLYTTARPESSVTSSFTLSIRLFLCFPLLRFRAFVCKALTGRLCVFVERHVALTNILLLDHTQENKTPMQTIDASTRYRVQKSVGVRH